MRKYLIVCMALAPLLGAAGAASPGAIAAPAVNSKSAPPLRPAVEAHLAAIAARDLDALLPTITSENDLVMIAPNGFKFDTRTQYVDFHRQWFASKDQGQLSSEIVHLTESPALGHALIKYRYTFKGPDGKEQSLVNWLALTFTLEQGTWRLVFDQNTPIAPK